jgi:hypothetical protein
MNPHQATIDEDGIVLNEEKIDFSDIYEVKWHDEQIAIEFYPYMALSKTLTDNIIRPTTALIIGIEDDMMTEVQQLLIQYLTTYQLHQIKNELENQGRVDEFRAEQCPVCKAMLDLTGYTPTNYIYCKHCETIFDKLRQPIPHSQNYKICPACDTYGRVQKFTEFSCYVLKNERRFGVTQHEFCDTCAERLVDKILWKNALFLLGLPSTILMRTKAAENRSAFYAELSKANRYAQDGKFKEAEDLYMLMMLRNEKHPALWFNHGLVYLYAEDYVRALQLFKRALEYCSNYKPVLDTIRINSTKEIFI